MVIAATNSGSGFIGGAIHGLGFKGGVWVKPPVVPAILPPIFAPKGLKVVQWLLASAAAAALIDGWSRIVAEPVPDVEDIARDLREAMEEAQRILSKGRKLSPYGKTTKKSPPSVPPVKGPQDYYVGPDLVKRIGKDIAEEPQTKELPDTEDERKTQRRTRRKRKEKVRSWFERRYSLALNSKNQLMLLPKELERAQRAVRRRNNAK